MQGDEASKVDALKPLMYIHRELLDGKLPDCSGPRQAGDPFQQVSPRQEAQRVPLP